MKKLLLLIFLVAPSSVAFAAAITIDFEQYPAYTQITNQYQATDGVTFTNALQLVAPYYDYFDYPPHSGNGVITNDPNDPIQVNFANNPLELIYSVSAWYTDPDGIVVTAYSGVGNILSTVIGAAVIGADDRFTISVPTSGPAISYITIADAGGNPDNETVDDLSAPEPGSLPLLGCAIFGLAAVLRRRIRR